MEEKVLWVVAGFGAIALLGAFYRMKGGFGPMNLRAIGIVLVASLASILAIGKDETLTAAMGILGGIAGYLFGSKSSSRDEQVAGGSTQVSADGASVGGHILGRGTITQTFNNIEKMLGDMRGLINATVQKVQFDRRGAERNLVTNARGEWEPTDSSTQKLLSSLEPWERTLRCLEDPSCLSAIASLVTAYESRGWVAKEVTFDAIRMGGIVFMVRLERSLAIA